MDKSKPMNVYRYLLVGSKSLICAVCSFWALGKAKAQFQSGSFRLLVRSFLPNETEPAAGRNSSNAMGTRRNMLPA